MSNEIDIVVRSYIKKVKDQYQKINNSVILYSICEFLV